MLSKLSRSHGACPVECHVYTSAAIKAASGDVVAAAEATSAALSIATATMVSRMLVIELDMAEMTTGTYKYLTLEFSNGADAGELTVVAVCDPRYAYSNVTIFKICLWM